MDTRSRALEEHNKAGSKIGSTHLFTYDMHLKREAYAQTDKVSSTHVIKEWQKRLVLKPYLHMHRQSVSDMIPCRDWTRHSQWAISEPCAERHWLAEMLQIGWLMRRTNGICRGETMRTAGDHEGDVRGGC